MSCQTITGSLAAVLILGILGALWLGYIIGREVERSYQADKRRGWK